MSRIHTLARTLVEDLLRSLTGPLGFWLRRQWYLRRLRKCGQGLRIGPGVLLENPEFMEFGDDVWIDRGVTLIAGPASHSARITVGTRGTGILRMGSYAHIGIRTIIQAHGDVVIGDYFTSSAGAKLYSLSNDPYNCHKGTYGPHDRDRAYTSHSITIGHNVWIGLDAIILGCNIANDCFIKPMSVVTGNHSSGWVLSGNPAQPVRERFPQASGLVGKQSIPLPQA